MTPETRTCCGTFMLRTGTTFECIKCGKTESIPQKKLPTEETVERFGSIAATNAERYTVKHKVLCVIPARMDSKRLPGKVLLAETGKPLIQHVWENAKSAKLIDETVIAIPAGEGELANSVREFSGVFRRTRDHQSGTDRAAECVQAYGGGHDIIINLQADEPEITGEDLDQLVHALVRRPEADMATLAWETTDATVAYVGHNVKVVTDPLGRAIYFSRAGIPHQGKAAAEGATEAFIRGPWKIHAGVYAYRREFLLDFAATPQSPLELAEGLEQLRALEMGAHIHVEMLGHPTRGIDTPGDYREFVASRKVVSAEK